MNTRRLFATFALTFGLGLSVSAADTAPAPAPKIGYTVVLDLQISETGTVEDAVVASTEDTSVDHILDRMAMETARTVKLQPRMKDGKPAKYTARAPYIFSVESDEGPEANKAPKPSIRSAVQPIYPPELAAKGEVGGVILELIIGADGKISSVKPLRSSHPLFDKAAIEAVNQWVFTPAKKDDVPVESRWRIALSFETDVQRAEWQWRFAPRPALGNYAVVHRTLPSEQAPVPPPAPAPAPANEVEKPTGK